MDNFDHINVGDLVTFVVKSENQITNSCIGEYCKAFGLTNLTALVAHRAGYGKLILLVDKSYPTCTFQCLDLAAEFSKQFLQNNPDASCLFVRPDQVEKTRTVGFGFDLDKIIVGKLVVSLGSCDEERGGLSFL